VPQGDDKRRSGRGCVWALNPSIMERKNHGRICGPGSTGAVRRTNGVVTETKLLLRCKKGTGSLVGTIKEGQNSEGIRNSNIEKMG